MDQAAAKETTIPGAPPEVYENKKGYTWVIVVSIAGLTVQSDFGFWICARLGM